MSSVPYLDLRAQHKSLKADLETAISGVLHSSEFVLGREVEAFEREFAAYCGAEHAVAVNSGTSALHLALLCCGIGPGDEVITVPMTFVATVAAIRYTGATPVFVDIDPHTFTLAPSALRDAISERTKAIVPVHLYGQMADMDAIMTFANQHGIAVIEDAAQAHGAQLGNHRAGGSGLAGCFSFYPGKNLGACGEGGALVTSDEDFAHRARMYRDWGQRARYDYAVQGYNYRMDAIQGAILRVKLHHLDGWICARREKAHAYIEQLAQCGLTLPDEPSGSRNVYHVFPVLTAQRDAMRNWLAGRGISTSVHYPIAIHLSPPHADLGYHKGDFPQSENVANSELSLPIYPELTSTQIKSVCEAVLSGVELHPA